MSNKSEYIKHCHQWRARLSPRQRAQLIRRYGTFKKALKAWVKTRETGLTNFEVS